MTMEVVLKVYYVFRKKWQ